MKIKKSPICLIVLALISIILITGSPFQITNDLVESNGHLYIKNIGQEVYGQEDEGGGDDDNGGSDDSDDSGDSNESEDSSDEESDSNGEEGEESEEATEEEEEHEDTDDNGYAGSVTVNEDGTKEPMDESDPNFEWDDEDGYKTEQQQKEDDYLSEENVDRSITYPGENEATETDEERASEEGEFIADLEDNLADAETEEERERIQDLLDRAKEKFLVDEASKNFQPHEHPKICDIDSKKGECGQKWRKDAEKLEEKQNPTPKDKKKDDQDPKTIIKKYYKDDDDNDNDIDDFAAYNTGYRNGKFDKINKMPFNDVFPFDNKDGQTWYKVGYRSGWDSEK